MSGKSELNGNMNYRGHLTVGIAFFLVAYATLLFALHIHVSVADALLGLALCEFLSLIHI